MSFISIEKINLDAQVYASPIDWWNLDGKFH
jgi:hypothetical protein